MTAILSSDTTRNSCGMLSSASPIRMMVSTADTTMNKALRMLLAAITRARWSSAVRA
ncbi:hypothetical protein D3C81_1968600 [compost metagenome]